jgi:toxin ParE1/3/4
VAAIRWTLGARQDFEELVSYVAQDSSVYAAILAERILAAVDRLEKFPRLGRIVPEYADPSLRELIVGNYRLVYRLRGSRIGLISIAHASRDLLRKLPSSPWDFR